MIKYKNTSLATRTFWGVTFKAGEVKEVPGWVNHPDFVRVPDNTPVSKQDAAVTQAKSSTPVKAENKSTETKAEVK